MFLQVSEYTAVHFVEVLFCGKSKPLKPPCDLQVQSACKRKACQSRGFTARQATS